MDGEKAIARNNKINPALFIVVECFQTLDLSKAKVAQLLLGNARRAWQTPKR